MTVKEIHVRSADKAFLTLEQLAKNFNVCFRGHRLVQWRLESTLARHRKIPPNERTTHELDEMIDNFIVNLTSIGIQLPFSQSDRRSRLEFARHYGIPSPLIDFSSSPYVAVFFAFSGIRPHDAKKGEHAVIYCLNMFELAGMWARDRARQLDGSIGEKFTEIHNNFLYNMSDPFTRGYESGILKYLDIPAS